MEPFHPFHPKPLDTFYARTTLTTVRVKNIPLIIAHDHIGDPIIADYKQEYQVVGSICLPSTYANAEDAINAILRRPGYQVVQPAEMAYRLEHVEIAEKMYGAPDRDNTGCFAVFKQHSRGAPCVGAIKEGHRLVTLSRLWREAEQDVLYVVSGIGCDESMAYPSRTIEDGITFPKLSRASRWCQCNELHPLDIESEWYWKLLLNSKNTRLPIARYSFAREVLTVYSVPNRK
jgi:hypothetical protein